MLHGHGIPRHHNYSISIPPMNTLTIHGMHCGACEKLIRMELEEHALDQYIDHIELYSDQKKGIMTLVENTPEANIVQMISVISGMDAYTVTRE